MGDAEAEKVGGMRIVGLIPARGGSKRLPGKNMRHLGGRPLIDWTISAAFKSEALDAVYVSTDSDEIADFAESRGCQVVWDSGAGEDMQRDVIEPFAKSVEWDGCVLLQPTSPLRGPDAVRWAAVNLRSGRGVVGATNEPRRSWVGTPGEWDHCFAFVETGAVYAFLRGRAVRSSDYAAAWTLPWQSVDIDTEDDFAIAELMLQRHRDEVWW